VANCQVHANGLSILSLNSIKKFQRSPCEKLGTIACLNKTKFTAIMFGDILKLGYCRLFLCLIGGGSQIKRASPLFDEKFNFIITKMFLMMFFFKLFEQRINLLLV
jgi:hypothetical protein